MKAYGGVDVWIHIFLTTALVGGEWSASRPCRFTPGERAPGTHWIGSCVGPRASLDYVEKRKFLALLGLEFRPLGRPADYAIPAPICSYNKANNQNLHCSAGTSIVTFFIQIGQHFPIFVEMGRILIL
jgi:hypothetical protein